MFPLVHNPQLLEAIAQIGAVFSMNLPTTLGYILSHYSFSPSVMFKKVIVLSICEET
jgi:hypothetical protein